MSLPFWFGGSWVGKNLRKLQTKEKLNTDITLISLLFNNVLFGVF